MVVYWAARSARAAGVSGTKGGTYVEKGEVAHGDPGGGCHRHARQPLSITLMLTAVMEVCAAPRDPPHSPLQPHRLPPALPPGGRAVASSRGSGPCHSLHCRISHRRPRIGAGSARSGGGRGRQRKGRKAWGSGGGGGGVMRGCPCPLQIPPGQRHPLCPLAGCSGPRGGSAPSQGHTARLTSCPGSGGSAGRAV